MYNNFSSKKTKKVISALLASALVVTSAPITANAATVKKVGVGKSITYNAKATVKKVTVKNKKVVKATKKGKKVTIKGLKAGTTTVTVKTAKKTIKLNVKVGATKIAKKTMKNTMTAGTSQTVSVTATGGKGDTIKFASSNKAVLTVNKTSAKASTKGIAKMGIKAVKEGTAKLTVSSKNTGVKKSFTIKVTAAQPAPTQAPTVVSTPGITTPTATVAATKAPSAVTTPGVTAPGTTNAPGTTDAAQTPGTDATQAPGTTDAASTDAPSTEATQTPGIDATQAPDVPVAETGTIAVTTNVSGASIKVLSGTSVVAEKTLEGETLTTTFADIKNGTYVVKVSKDGYATVTENVVVAGNDLKVDANLELVKALSAKAKSETKVQINFNGEIDEVAVTNFKVSNATVTSAKLSEDKKSVIVETSTMTKGENYTITTTGLTSNGVAVADAEFTFEAKEVKYELKLSFAGDKTTIASNGKDAVLVTAAIYDEDGDLISDLDKVEIQFTTTAGNFAENRVTVQNGKATNMLTSEISTKDISALVTATVVSASNTNILNVNASKTILMTPNIEQAEDQTIGATLTDIAVETADRVVLYFNKDVDVADYTEQDDTTTPKRVYNYAPSKMEVLVLDNADSATTSVTSATANKSVIALAPVEGNSKALYAILDVDHGDVLTDNSKVVVKVTDKTKTVETYGEKSTLVSDIRVPSILGVENDGLTTLKVIFSEPIQSTLGGGTDYAANVASHWIIDGTPLTSAKYGSNTVAKATVGKFDTATGEDERNIVTIELGTNSSNEQIYFQSGAHSIQGNNIGDWANLTDVKNNIINTQTLDFVIDPDETVPTAEVKVESPEQYTVTFNKMVDTTKVANNLKLQKYDTTSAKWVDVAEDSASDNGIVITPVDAKNGLAKEYVVERNKDWTKALSTSTKYVNYYNNDYRLHVEEKKISNPSNGLTNAEIALNLNDDIMKTLDATSPEIKSVEQIGTKNQFTVTMSEPVQVANTLEDGAAPEILTPSETQGSAVQKTTVTFISEDGKTTVPGKILRMTDAHDTAFVVQPSTATLTAGTWKIVITGLSDDYGNTISTRSDKTFEVKTVTDTVDTSFKVQWIVAVPADNYAADPIGKNGYNDGTDGDIVYVKFNKKFKTYGGAANAVSTTNYTVNGYAVPTTSKIDASVIGYNHLANEKNNYTDLVAIHLPKGTLTNKSNTVNISSTIEAFTGGTVSNYGMKVLDKVGNIYTYNYKTLSAAADLDTVAEIQKAFANSEYVGVTVPSDLTGEEATKVATTDLTIKSIGTYDLTAVTQTWQSLTIDTEETGTIEIKGGTYGKIDITAPNADVIIDGVKVTGTTGNINVNDVLSGTLTIKGSATSISGKVIITDSNDGCAVKLDSSVTNDVAVEVKTTGKVTLDLQGAGTGNKLNIVKAEEVEFLSEPNNTTITFDSEAKGIKITATDAVADGLASTLASQISNGTVKMNKIDTIAPTVTAAAGTADDGTQVKLTADEDCTFARISGPALADGAPTTLVKSTQSADITFTTAVDDTVANTFKFSVTDASGNVKKYVLTYSAGWTLKTFQEVEEAAIQAAFNAAGFGEYANLEWSASGAVALTQEASTNSGDDTISLPTSVAGQYTIEYTAGTNVTGFTYNADASEVVVAKDTNDSSGYELTYVITSATDGSTITGTITITANNA